MMDTVDQRSTTVHCKMTSSVSPSPMSANAQLRKVSQGLRFENVVCVGNLVVFVVMYFDFATFSFSKT
jgi:hypothetical protein